MKFTFNRPADIDIKAFEEIVSKLHADLDTLINGKPSKEEVFDYVSAICESVRPLPHDPRMHFLGLADPSEMPSDARVEFFYQPTYIATAFIIKAILLYPDLLDGACTCSVGVNQHLKNMMIACTGRSFSGAGVLPAREVVRIFDNAGAIEFFQRYPSYCHRFSTLLDRIRAEEPDI